MKRSVGKKNITGSQDEVRTKWQHLNAFCTSISLFFWFHQDKKKNVSLVSQPKSKKDASQLGWLAEGNVERACPVSLKS